MPLVSFCAPEYIFPSLLSFKLIKKRRTRLNDVHARIAQLFHDCRLLASVQIEVSKSRRSSISSDRANNDILLFSSQFNLLQNLKKSSLDSNYFRIRSNRGNNISKRSDYSTNGIFSTMKEKSSYRIH